MDIDTYRKLREEVKRDIDVAANERDGLRSRLSVQEQRLAGLQQLERSISAILSEEPLDHVALTLPTSSVQREANSAGRELHADVAERVLRAAGREMKTLEIATEMVRLGHPLPDDPRQREGAVYSAMLRRSNTFERAGRGIWTLKEPGKSLSQNLVPPDPKATDEPQLSALHALLRSNVSLSQKRRRKTKR